MWLPPTPTLPRSGRGSAPPASREQRHHDGVGSADNTSAADALLRLGANPRVRDGKYGATAAGWADFAGRRETCARILEADVDVFDAIACATPARVAAILDADPAALHRPLGDYGGRPEDAAMTPLAWATQCDKPEMVALLQARGARPRTP